MLKSYVRVFSIPISNFCTSNTKKLLISQFYICYIYIGYVTGDMLSKIYMYVKVCCCNKYNLSFLLIFALWLPTTKSSPSKSKSSISRASSSESSSVTTSLATSTSSDISTPWCVSTHPIIFVVANMVKIIIVQNYCYTACYLLKITIEKLKNIKSYYYSAYHQIVTFCDFLGNFRKSTKNTTKLENSSSSYGFLKFLL